MFIDPQDNISRNAALGLYALLKRRIDAGAVRRMSSETVDDSTLTHYKGRTDNVWTVEIGGQLHGWLGADSIVFAGHRSLRISAVWVDTPKTGMGSTLYRVAHAESQKGLVSSDTLCAGSLALWVSLARRNTIELYRDRLVPLKVDADFTGRVPTVDGQLITKLKDDFLFFWPK